MNLIDCIVKNLPNQTQSYVRDDIDFLSKLQTELPNDAEFSLVTLDISSLYTNINHDLGVKAMQYWISKLRHLIPRRFTEDFITDAIRLVLDNNSFFFNDHHFKQIKGTAMGTKMAPNYVTLVLAYLEEHLYESLKADNADYGEYIQNN